MNYKKAIINFGAGPAALPSEVLKAASEAILDYNESGDSILCLAHRSNDFLKIIEEAKFLVLEIAELSEDEYEVLWMQGGGRMQFAMIPMNFLSENKTAGYIDSGFWANDAEKNAQFFGKTITLASSKSEEYKNIPKIEKAIPKGLSYVHLTTNNTIYGTQIKETICCNSTLIADMSSDIFSEKRDYSKYDLFYAVAQKNLGAAGVTMVVIRKNLLDKTVRDLAPILSYKEHAAHQSILNTPPVFNIYLSLLYLRWIKNKSIEKIALENIEKAKVLYHEIDRNPLFEGISAVDSRSKMNIVFKGKDIIVEQKFIDYCSKNGIIGIEGHRSVGGLRVSLYNAISIDQVTYLVSLMQEFEENF